MANTVRTQTSQLCGKHVRHWMFRSQLLRTVQAGCLAARPPDTMYWPHYFSRQRLYVIHVCVYDHP